MIEDDFYATLKLKTGEEIFAKIAATEEEDRTMLLVSNPIIIHELKGKMGVVGYKLEPWLKTTTDDMFIINLADVLTMSESSDVEITRSLTVNIGETSINFSLLGLKHSSIHLPID